MNVGVCGAGIFALLDCLPGMAFTLTLFRKRLRLGVRATVAVCALLVVIQVVAGSLRYRHVDDNAYMALMLSLLVSSIRPYLSGAEPAVSAWP